MKVIIIEERSLREWSSWALGGNGVGGSTRGLVRCINRRFRIGGVSLREIGSGEQTPKSAHHS